MEIKEQLQKFFDKDIYSISKHNGLYYVVLEGPEFIKPVWVVDVKKGTKTETGIPLPELESYELIYSKFNE